MFFLCIFSHFSTRFCSGCFRQGFFHLGYKKWQLVALDRWSSYTVTNVMNLTWVDSAFVVLNKRLSYRGGHLNMFDYNILSQSHNQLQNKNIHINQFTFSLWQIQRLSSSGQITQKLEICGDAGDSLTKCLWNSDNVPVRVQPCMLNQAQQ